MWFLLSGSEIKEFVIMCMNYEYIVVISYVYDLKADLFLISVTVIQT